MPLPFTPPLFERFAHSIRSLPPLGKKGPEHLCTPPRFGFARNGGTELFYAPFDSVNTSAKVAVVGIRLGLSKWRQLSEPPEWRSSPGRLEPRRAASQKSTPVSPEPCVGMSSQLSKAQSCFSSSAVLPW